MSRQKGLSRYAFEPLPENQPYEPYVPAAESPLEFSFKAVVLGAIFGVLFGAANAYLGLQAGLTISTSIPVAVMTVAAFRALQGIGRSGTILEANMSQTIGSASSSVASGVIFTLPALYLWGLDPALLQMTLLAMCGGLLGVLFMIPLRRYLIEREHGKLPYPEGTACAEVLVASNVGGTQARNVFLGLGLGAVFKFVFEWLKVFPYVVKVPITFIPRAELGLKLSSALYGVGYILGPRIGSVMVAGGLLSSLVIIPAIYAWGKGRVEPLYPETSVVIAEMTAHDIWHKYVRYIGAGAVATAGFITLIRSFPTMIQSFRLAIGQIQMRNDGTGADEPRTGRDLPFRFVIMGVVILTVVLAAVPQIFTSFDSAFPRAIAAVCVVIFAFFFVTVASRIVGLVGVTSNPTSGMTIASLLGTSLVFVAFGWTGQTGMAGALAVGCVIAIAASIAGDTSQDLKTGFLLGATPRRQQIGELIGVLTSATFVCITLIMLDKAYGFGSDELPAPQATLMKVVIEGVLQAKLPWVLVGIGAGIAIAAELARVPSLPFAVGVYLPVTTMVPVFLGGATRYVVERRAPGPEAREAARERGVLLGSGFVGGEGLMGVVIAGVVVAVNALYSRGTIDSKDIPLQRGTEWVNSLPEWLTRVPVDWASILGLVLFGLLAAGFVRLCRR
jgi:putative OPT family oligopeptide transporter